MIIVDTSVWIEFFKNNLTVSAALRREIEQSHILAIECVFAELLQGVRHRKEAEIITKYWELLPKIEERGLWIKAGLLGKGIGLIDACIITAARNSKSQLWSLDKKLNAVLKPLERFVC